MAFFFVFLKILRIFFGYFYKPVVQVLFKFYNRNIDKSSPLPKIKNPILLLPANKLADKIRNKELKSFDIVQAYVNRIKEIQPLVNCVVYELYELALEQAKEVDDILSQNKVPEKYSVKNAPLLGVPFSCKESIWVKGCPNSTGLIVRKDFRAPSDADVVKYMKESGAILTCLTNTSELCMWFESSNYLYGCTKNPYNLSRIVGGSSGGEGCIIGSAGSVVGIGSDIGGSIRMPAYFNGVYGHKPTSNFISNNAQHPTAIGIQNDMLTTGPICRYGSDLRLLFKIFSGPRYTEVAEKFEEYGNLLASDLSTDTRNALNKTISFFEKSLGIEVKELHVPKLKSIIQIWASMMNNEESSQKTFVKLLSDFKPDQEVSILMELLKTVLGVQKMHTLPALGYAIFQRIKLQKPKHYIDLGIQIKNELKSILGNDGVLFFPSFPIVAPYHNQPAWTNPLDWIYYGTFNAIGFPVTQVPLGLSEEGLPTGVQIIANHNNDHLTIKIAEYIESNLVGWTEPS